MKNITLIGINYAPEDSAIGLYSSQMMEYLESNGNKIDVITGFPYYPQWEILDKYKSKPTFFNEVVEGVKVHRYRQYVPKNPSFKKRIIHLIDFTLGSFRNLFKIKKCDIVIAVVPFTTSVLLGIMLAKMKGAKLWVHIQDFEFDAARESGLAGGGGVSVKVFGVLMKLESWLLNKADIVSTISYSMIEKLKTKTDTPNYFFPNWVDSKDINPETAKQHKLLNSKKFKILYSGNIGAKQCWDSFIKVAEHYKDNDSIEFIVVGGGANKQDLVSKTIDLKNVKHFDPVEFSELSDLLCSADLHVLFQKNDVVDTVMPSKILGMMASGKPSIVTGSLKSETAKMFGESGGGYFYDGDDLKSVIAKIDELNGNKKEAEKTGTDARKYIINKFSKNKILQSFNQKIEEICQKS